MPWVQYDDTTNLVLARQGTQGTAKAGTTWEETTQFELGVGWYRNGANDFTPTPKRTAAQSILLGYKREIHQFALIAEHDVLPVWSEMSGVTRRYKNTVAWSINWIAYVWNQVDSASADSAALRTLMGQIRAEFAIGMRNWYDAHLDTVWSNYRNDVYTTNTSDGSGNRVAQLGNDNARQRFVDTHYVAALKHQG